MKALLDSILVFGFCIILLDIWPLPTTIFLFTLHMYRSFIRNDLLFMIVSEFAQINKFVCYFILSLSLSKSCNN